MHESSQVSYLDSFFTGVMKVLLDSFIMEEGDFQDGKLVLCALVSCVNLIASLSNLPISPFHSCSLAALLLRVQG